jgi:hypothetical protein
VIPGLSGLGSAVDRRLDAGSSILCLCRGALLSDIATPCRRCQRQLKTDQLAACRALVSIQLPPTAAPSPRADSIIADWTGWWAFTCGGEFASVVNCSAQAGSHPVEGDLLCSSQPRPGTKRAPNRASWDHCLRSAAVDAADGAHVSEPNVDRPLLDSPGPSAQTRGWTVRQAATTAARIRRKGGAAPAATRCVGR